jgi:hypothetical protein
MKSPDSLRVAGYAVAVLDFVGQSEALRKLEELFDPRRMTPEALAAFKRTFGAVRDFGDTLHRTFDLINNTRADDPSLTPQQQKELSAAPQDTLVCQTFGDTALLYQSLDGVAIPVHGIHALLRTCSTAVLGCLAAHQLLRGGIELGMAAEVRPRELYGPALMRAHFLESEVAGYPRVAVGDGLPAYLKWVRDSAGSDPAGKVVRFHAEACLGLLGLDLDGKLVLDYLKAWFFKSDPGPARQSVTEAYTFAKSEAEKFEHDGIPKLAKNYRDLVKYFESRAEVWPDCIISGK